MDHGRQTQPHTRLPRILGAAAIAITLIGFIGLCVWIADDAPPPECADLAFLPRTVADQQNLYLGLARYCAGPHGAPLVPSDQEDESLPLPPPELVSFGDGPPELMQASRPLLVKRLSEGRGWNPERLSVLGPALDERVRRWREISRLPDTQAPFAPADTALAQSFPIRAALLPNLQLACWAAYRSGQADEAVARALLGYRLGLSIRDSRGSLDDYLNGLRIAQSALDTLQALLDEPDFPSETLAAVRAELASLNPARSDRFADSLLHQFARACHHIETLTPGAVSGDMQYAGTLALAARTRVLFPIAFRRQETLTTIMHTTRHALADAARDIPPPPAPASGTSFQVCRHCQLIAPDNLADFDNAVGDLLARDLLSPGMIRNIRRDFFQLRETHGRLISRE